MSEPKRRAAQSAAEGFCVFLDMSAPEGRCTHVRAGARTRHVWAQIGVLLFCLLGLPAGAAEAPWRLRAALDAPDWLQFGIQHRLRYETLDEQFRARGNGGDQLLGLQTLVALRVGGKRLGLGLEFEDARAWLDDAGTPLDTGLINTAELLQGYLEWMPEALNDGATFSARLGRITRDFGSRRLIARNRFRNTMNNFTGLDLRFMAPAGWELEGLAAMPVVRRPSDRAALDANSAMLDEEDTGSALWLAAWRSAGDKSDPRLELYVVGLHESDGRFDTRNRRLWTPGARLYRDPAPGHFDYQIEVMGQLGEIRASSSAVDRQDLQQRAHFESVYAGYTWSRPLVPRLGLLFDHASGDDDPEDRESQRFDTLFGARRGELGPSGIFGPISRANLLSVGTRGTLQPWSSVQAMLSHRANWLASARDAWSVANLRDPQGRSGSFIGHQVEFTVQWTPIKDGLLLEMGGAWLSSGGFRSQVGPPDDPAASSYLYTQMTLIY